MEKLECHILSAVSLLGCRNNSYTPLFTINVYFFAVLQYFCCYSNIFTKISSKLIETFGEIG